MRRTKTMAESARPTLKPAQKARQDTAVQSEAGVYQKLQSITGRPLVLCLALLVLVALAFSPLLFSGFIDFDDDLYITGNRYVQAGLTWTGIKWAFQSTAASNWHPVTWLSHMLDCQIYGLQPWGHHLSSIMLHGLNTVLVFLVLKRLTAARWPSLFVAALFGLHPLHVESVAWAAERKDVLSTLFFLLTLWGYAKYCEKRQTSSQRAAVDSRKPGKKPEASGWGAGWFYAMAVGVFALGLMTKPMLVSLPVVLLLLDFWPLRRWPAPCPGTQSKTAQPRAEIGVIGRLLFEKMPFIGLAAISSVVTFLVQQHSGAMTEMAKLSTSTRVENAVLSYGRYLGKMVWPADLTLFYPFPEHLNPVSVAVAAGLLVVMSALALWGWKRWPWLVSGWGWFVVTLVPVIGLVQAGGQAMADRYSYIPLIGVFIVLAWAGQTAVAAARASMTGALAWAGRSLSLVPIPVVLVCAVLTYHQANYWRTSESLWSHALAVTRDNFLAHINLGLELQRQKRLPEAEAQFRAAVKLRPGESKAHANLANVLCREERADEGIQEFEEAIRLNPNSPAARHNLAIALCRRGRLSDGIAQFEAVLKLRPESPQTEFELAMALVGAERRGEAISHLQRALQLRPDFAEAQRELMRLRTAR